MYQIMYLEGADGVNLGLTMLLGRLISPCEKDAGPSRGTQERDVAGPHQVPGNHEL